MDVHSCLRQRTFTFQVKLYFDLQILPYTLPIFFSQEPNSALFSIFYIDSSPRGMSSQPQEAVLGKSGPGVTSGTARWPLDVCFAHLLGFSDQESELEIE